MKERLYSNNSNLPDQIKQIIEPSEEDKILIKKFEDILNNTSNENIKLLVKAIIKFLSANIITDTFENHQQRREFIDSLDPQQVEFILNNRLRANIFSPILELIELNNMFLEDENFKKEFDELFETAKNYRNFNIEEKLNFIERMKNFCVMIYKKIKEPTNLN